MRKLKKYTPTKFMSKGSYYDKAAADYAVSFIEQLRHTKGEFYNQPFELIDWQERIIRDIFGTIRADGYRQFNTAYIEISKKSGKQLSLNTLIPTPNGYTTMGEIKVGDELFDDNGCICHVVAKSQLDFSEQAYRITFKDGAVVEAGEHHQWFGEYTHGKRKSIILTTRELLSIPKDGNSYRFRIPVAGCVDYTLVLTVLSTLSNVSIYSVYFLVVSGVKQLFLSMTGGIQALIGELWARKEKDALEQTFNWFEWLLHTGTVFVFGCTAMLIVPFESVYTNGMQDANYIQPMFGVLLVIANAGHCLRLPYNVMILAAGHYKQTQRCYIIAVIINIVLSVVLVFFFGLVGVAIGTLAAMFYQTIWMALYNSKFLIKRSIKVFFKQSIVDIITAVSAALATFWIPMMSISYLSWILMAAEIAIIWIVIIVAFNIIFYKDKMAKLFFRIKIKVGK